jgi:shikimate dehydrogenase
MSSSARPRRACVIGYPIKQSRSPLIHGHWLATYGLEGSYDKVEVAPADLAGFIRSMPDRSYVGCNVTVPHKEAAFALVDEATERAQSLGAVNTLWFEEGRLHGDNTDILGFLAHADASVPRWDREVGCAVVLGAGGAARGVVAGLLSRGIRRVAVVNRTPARAAALAAQCGSGVEAQAWEALPALLGEADLLVNTTSLGMQGQPPLEIDLSAMKPGGIVDDIVYVPLETDLLKQAREHGLRRIDGLGMLLHQAVPGFAHWFGRLPGVTPALRAIIEADILGQRPA